MKKVVFTNNIIRAIFILGLLILAFVKNEHLYLRLFIISFILLIICNIAKNLCNLLNKSKIANIFHKLFVIIFILFVIAFLIIWSYLVFKNKQYFSLLFTIPFWIFAIYIIRKYLFGIKTNSIPSNKKFDYKFIIPAFLVFTVLLVGIVCLFMGIKDTYSTNKKTKDYILTTGVYQDYEIYDSNDRKGTTYRLIYVYKVDNKKYEIKTDYGSGSIPSANSERKIKYNPNDPSEAIFLGTNKNNMLIYFGAFFLLGGMVFVLEFLYIIGVFDKIRINIFGLYIGFVFFVIGIGIIAIQIGEGLSIFEIIKEMKFWFLIPIMFLIVGVFQIIKCLFFERLKIK